MLIDDTLTLANAAVSLRANIDGWNDLTDDDREAIERVIKMARKLLHDHLPDELIRTIKGAGMT